MPGAPAKHGRAQIVAAGAGRRLESVGHYREAFRCGPSGWRVAHRRITLG
ncbi:hypothetical protein [Actinomadura sp. CNU-125]|nr:hypothetical protein [Actinomadura sp. CNU-125]